MSVRAPVRSPRPAGGARRHRWRRWPAILLVLAVLAGAVGYVVGFSSVFDVRQVRVAGVAGTEAAAVRAAVRAPIGQPLARIDTGAMARRVAAVPVVAQATVTRSWPHTVDVAVRPRVAVGAVRSGARLTLVDVHAVPFRAVSAIPAGLPQIDAQLSDTPALRAACAVAAALPEHLRAAVRAITAPTPDSVGLRLADGAQVLWGNTDRSAFKAEVLTALLHQHARRYDVSAPDLPTTSG